MTGNSSKHAVMVVYYLPSKTTRGTGLGYKTPAMMRKNGFVAFDGSCWFGHRNAVPSLDFSAVTAAGGRFQVVTFTEQQWDEVRVIARMGLEQDIDEIMATVNAKVEKARDLFERANREQSVNGVRKASRYLTTRIRLAKKRLNEALEAASIFDLMGDTENLFNALRASIAAHEETSSAVRAITKARVRAAKLNPDAPWGFEAIEEVA